MWQLKWYITDDRRLLQNYLVRIYMLRRMSGKWEMDNLLLLDFYRFFFLWNAEETSPEVQNRGISGPTKRTYVLQKFVLKKKILFPAFKGFFNHVSKAYTISITFYIVKCLGIVTIIVHQTKTDQRRFLSVKTNKPQLPPLRFPFNLQGLDWKGHVTDTGRACQLAARKCH